MFQNILSLYTPYIFLVTGIALLMYSYFYTSTKSKLKETGVAVDGIIYEQNSNNNSSGMFENSSNVKNKITVRFVTADQDQLWITGVMNQPFQSFYTGQYKNGETVKVYYDKNNPSNFFVDTKQSEVVGRIIAGLAGFILIVIGVYKLLV